jgi:hypothetical protein
VALFWVALASCQCSAGGIGISLIPRSCQKPWPKLFVNLRSTRQTELVQEHPIHLVCHWLGHSALIAREHSVQIRDEDFAAAANPFSLGPETGGAESGALSEERAAQTPEGHAGLPSGIRRNSRQDKEFSQARTLAASACLNIRIPPAGLEPATYCLGNNRSIL